MGGEEKYPVGLRGGEKQREERKEREKQREERKERKEREKQKEERKEIERDEGKKTGCSSSDLRHFDGRNSLDQEVKSVYSTRATLQEMGILPTWFISTLRAVWPCFGTIGNAALF